MPDIGFLNALLPWLKGIVPWLALIVAPLLFVLRAWAKLNWEALNDREKKPESYANAIALLRENSWGKLYLNALGWLLDKISGWIGDRDKLNQSYVTAANPKGVIHKTFGFNPFTSESYDKLLRLAFLYPILSFFIAWAMGGDGQVGNAAFLGKEAAELEDVSQRWLLLLGMVGGMVLSLWMVFRGSGWRRWLLLGAVLMVWSGIVSLFGGEFVNAFLVLLAVFGVLFLPMYVIGWLTGLSAIPAIPKTLV